MEWINDWPVIGTDMNGDGKGEPVPAYKKPNVGKVYPIINPQESDEFNGTKLGNAMQARCPGWMGLLLPPRLLRIYAQQILDSIKNLWGLPSILTQKFPAEDFIATVNSISQVETRRDKFGLIIFGWTMHIYPW
jgi:hypothetical protein